MSTQDTHAEKKGFLEANLKLGLLVLSAGVWHATLKLFIQAALLKCILNVAIN